MAYELFTKDTPQIRGVLLDMDGLVLDTEKLYCRFWREACAHFGFPMTQEQALRMRFKGDSRRLGIQLAGQSLALLQQRLVPQVHTIKETQGEYSPLRYGPL